MAIGLKVFILISVKFLYSNCICLAEIFICLLNSSDYICVLVCIAVTGINVGARINVVSPCIACRSFGKGLVGFCSPSMRLDFLHLNLVVVRVLAITVCAGVSNFLFIAVQHLAGFLLPLRFKLRNSPLLLNSAECAPANLTAFFRAGSLFFNSPVYPLMRLILGICFVTGIGPLPGGILFFRRNDDHLAIIVSLNFSAVFAFIVVQSYFLTIADASSLLKSMFVLNLLPLMGHFFKYTGVVRISSPHSLQ